MIKANASIEQLVYAKDSQAALELATCQKSIPSVFRVFQEGVEAPIVAITDRNLKVRVCDGEHDPLALREHLHNTAVGSPRDGAAYVVVWDIESLEWDQTGDTITQAQQVFAHIFEPAVHQRQQGETITDLPCSRLSLEILDLKEAVTLVHEDYPQGQPDPLSPDSNDAVMQPS